MERAYCGDFLFPELAPPGPTPAASSPIPSQATPRGWRCGRRLHLLMNLSGCVILFEDELYRFSSPDPALTKHLAGAVCHSLKGRPADGSPKPCGPPPAFSPRSSPERE